MNTPRTVWDFPSRNNENHLALTSIESPWDTIAGLIRLVPVWPQFQVKLESFKQSWSGPSDFLRPVTREWQCLSCLLRAACECFCPPNRKAAEMLQRLLRFTWSEVELEMLEGSYKRNESHALVRTLTYKKAIEIRFRTLGAHPDTGFDPKKGLWSSLYWLLIHRCTQLHADILQPSLQGFVFKWN